MLKQYKCVNKLDFELKIKNQIVYSNKTYPKTYFPLCISVKYVFYGILTFLVSEVLYTLCLLLVQMSNAVKRHPKITFLVIAFTWNEQLFLVHS